MTNLQSLGSIDHDIRRVRESKWAPEMDGEEAHLDHAFFWTVEKEHDKREKSSTTKDLDNYARPIRLAWLAARTCRRPKCSVAPA